MTPNDQRQHDRARAVQLRESYSELTSHDYRRRWSLTNRGNLAAYNERQRMLATLARDQPTNSGRLLDLGCGELSLIPGLDHLYRIGLDLLFDRLLAVEQRQCASLVNGDGCQLPFNDESFQVITMFTMLSSVLDQDVRLTIADEVGRVLSPGGMVLWYDFRYPSPRNAAVRPVRASELRRLFPDFDVKIRSTTLLPPLARRLGLATPVVYPVASALPLLRSHLVARLVKPL